MVVYITLKEILNIRTNFEDADFWIIRKGQDKMLGKPTKEFALNHIGLQLNDVGRSLFDPNYLYYLFEFLHGQGVWRQLAKGSLALQHITVSDAKNFSIPMEVPDNFGA
jgi:hypothetical protein